VFRSSRRAFLALAFGALALGASASTAGAASLYVSQHALGANSVAQFHIGSGGLLQPLNPATIGAGQRPLGIAASPNGQSVYALNVSSGDIAQYSVSPSGELAAKSPFLYHPASPGEAGGRGIAVSMDSANVYAVGYDGTTFTGLFQMAADGGGLLSALEPPLIASSDPREIVVHPTLPKVYASNYSAGGIKVMTIEAEGILDSSGSATAALANGLTITPDGRFLYSAASNSKAVYGFKVDQTTGALSAIAGSPWEYTEGNGQDIAATNTNVYATALSEGVAMFDIDQTTGALTLKSPEKVTPKGNPSGIVVSPEGTSVYVAITNGSIAQYDIAAGGALTPKSPATLALSGQPEELAVSLTGTGEDEALGPQPTPPPPLPPKPPPPPVKVTEYMAYQHREKEVLVMRLFKEDGKIVKIEMDVAKCYPPPEVKTKCAGLVEVRIRRSGFLAVVDENERPNISAAKKNPLLAKGKFSIPAGKGGKIKLNVTGAGRKAMKGKKSFKGWLVTKLDNGAAGTISGQQKLTFKLK
jgi:6-phosphogluconolactonase (cycloisomerase 2 family)